MSRRVGSLQTRLVLWLIGAATVLGLVLLIDARTGARADADRAYDRLLEAAALTMADSIRWQDGWPVVDVPAAALRILATADQERVFYAVFDSKHRRLTTNLDITIDDASLRQALQSPIWRDIRYQDVGWRLYGRRFELAGWASRESLQIWVGHTTAGRQALAHRLFIPSAVRFAILILVAGLFGVIAIRSILAPLQRLRARLRRRASSDLSPLSTRVPVELDELVATLNDLLARQRAHRSTLVRFTADASHQLKTPLAGLQNAAELALRTDDPAAWRSALEQIHASADRTSRLAAQLLSLARLRNDEAASDDIVDLASLARTCTREQADRTSAAAYDIGFEADSHDCRIFGDAWALRELLHNLIDNALKYTPPGTEITVDLRRRSERVCLRVTDDGPGVTDDQLTRLHQPFERGQTADPQGSGLGLAIADSVARRHRATLGLSTPSAGGFRVTVDFPALAQESAS